MYQDSRLNKAQGGSGPKNSNCSLQGFYHRPWTRGQRMDLFGKMKCYGLNAYLYAPKDDHKHRALWRDAYDGPERDELR